jgi:hypothetical protein
MVANTWFDESIQRGQTGVQPLAAQQDDDDAAIDDWMASMSTYQFDEMLNLLMDRFGGSHSSMAAG